MLNFEYITQQLCQDFAQQSTFIVAVSGGIDSMVLLDLISKITKYKFIIVTINHSIRADSALDVLLVQHICEKKQLICKSEKVAVPTLAKQERKGLEESARELRYQVLQKYRKKYHAAAIITAHHQDDQLETILFHLIRGSDIKGLIGMEKLNQQGIYRPLLMVPKSAIIAYAHQHKIQWHEDSTNTDSTISRNFVRQHIVPLFPRSLLLELNSQAKQTVIDLEHNITAWIETHINTEKERPMFTKTDFLQLPLYLQFYLLQYLTRHCFKLTDYSFSGLSSMYQWILKSKTKSTLKHKTKVLLRNNKNTIEIEISRN